jgi:hypothetical protein
VTIFCAHDADAYGTMIYQTFQEATKARGARKIQIVNVGLEPWEAIERGFDIEDMETTDRRRPVADYVRDHAGDWDNWLQTHRVELNAMTTPDFIAWLDEKLADYAKLIPPPAVLEAELAASIEQKVRDAVVERVLREANIDAQIAEAIAAIEAPPAAALVEGIEQLFAERPAAAWREHIEAAATDLTDGDAP